MDLAEVGDVDGRGGGDFSGDCGGGLKVRMHNLLYFVGVPWIKAIRKCSGRVMINADIVAPKDGARWRLVSICVSKAMVGWCGDGKGVVLANKHCQPIQRTLHASLNKLGLSAVPRNIVNFKSIESKCLVGEFVIPTPILTKVDMRTISTDRAHP
ncbi:TIFY domain/Divergent CCT motif family protein [Striga asiatica]|uniref:TIFY domain/Divergent CCT motif family protein n=1 Tax=Striga asiatica TaxID=4170 RepID=A0A5A7QML6_STRAF|nr:TIFY domain/Divergent CCT motif family protein [Striga asiatica]